MNIISIDFSKISTGVYTNINGKESSFAIKIKSSVKLPDVICIIYNEFTKILDDNSYDYGLIEWIYRGTSLLKISGVICLAFAQHKIPLVEIPTMTWKSVLGICRLDKKHGHDKYMLFVKTKYGKVFETTDEADAYMMYQVVKQICKETKVITPAATKIREQIKKIMLNKITLK